MFQIKFQKRLHKMCNDLLVVTNSGKVDIFVHSSLKPHSMSYNRSKSEIYFRNNHNNSNDDNKIPEYSCAKFVYRSFRFSLICSLTQISSNRIQQNQINQKNNLLAFSHHNPQISVHKILVSKQHPGKVLVLFRRILCTTVLFFRSSIISKSSSNFCNTTTNSIPRQYRRRFSSYLQLAIHTGTHNFNTQFSGSQSQQPIGFPPQNNFNFASQQQQQQQQTWPGKVRYSFCEI